MLSLVKSRLTGKTLFFIFIACFLSSFLSATIINVPTPYATIQAGIDAAANTDTVLVQPGTYVENINYYGKLITVGSLFLTTLDTTYISSTIIDGSQPSNPDSASVVTFVNGEYLTAKLIGFSIINGTGTDDGTGSTFGGGIYCLNQSSPTISNCIIRDNRTNGVSGDGGGIWCNGSSLTISHSTISGNTANRDGGGIHIYNFSNPYISYVIISGNYSAGRGGGICNGSNSFLFLENVTFTGNVSDDTVIAGGAIACIDTSDTFVLNSILWNDLPFEIGTDGSMIAVDYSDIEIGWVGIGNIYDDPLFVDANNDNFNLLFNSPCIDSGHPDPFYYDPDGTRNDMGACPFDGSAQIAAITDIPHDQGRNVQVRWYRCPFDQQGASITIESYSVWRYDDILGENNQYEIFDNPWEILEQDQNSVQNYYWQRDEQILTFITQLPAVGYSQYSIVSPTLIDSSVVSNDYSVFEVLAHTDVTLHYYTSLPDSGYSVDNIAPDETEVFIAQNGTNMNLSWDEVEYGTFQGNSYPEINGIWYKIYAGDTPDFVCDEAHLIDTVTNLNYDYPIAGVEKKFFKIKVSDQP